MNQSTSNNRTRRIVRKAFSLIELVIVVVIIAIIGAIAIPKMSRGAAGAGDAALTQDLAVLRSALDLYQAENGGQYPTVANVYQALVQYNDGNGGLSATKDSTHIYGPYLRSVPACPVGTRKTQDGITDGSQYSTKPSGAPGSAASSSNAGWLYNSATGQVTANTAGTEMDSTGNKAWSAY